MIVTESVSWLRSRIEELKKSANSIGFVPTMGTLHKGHLSIVKKAAGENDICIVSIFVNPKQFNNSSDLEKYPRTIKEDLSMLDKHLTINDIVFIPSVEEIYKNHEQIVYDLGSLENVMEGKYRDGHFQGVATIVKILFDIITPDKAYFGIKDYQQYLIIKKLVKITGHQITIIPCSIVREKNGLAMSSRNNRLSDKQRQSAGIIFKALETAQSLASTTCLVEIKKDVTRIINSATDLDLEYFTIVDSETLMDVDNMNSATGVIACIAVYAGEIRLIDNIILK